MTQMQPGAGPRRFNERIYQKYAKALAHKTPESGQDRIRGSVDISLTPDGVRQAHLIGKCLNKLGGSYLLVSSNLKRAKETTNAILAENPLSFLVDTTKELHPWHLGKFEGQPTARVINRIHDYVLHHPNMDVPGRGVASTANGESFNDFKERFLTCFEEICKSAKHMPNACIIVVTHLRNIRVLSAWLKAGAPSNHVVDEKEMIRPMGTPGSFYKVNDTLDEINLAKVKHLDPGIYLLRHGHTEWNNEQPGVKQGS